MDLIKAPFFAGVGIFVALLGIFAAAASRQLTDEFKAWTPWFVDRLIRRAVRQLPKNQRARYTEEWKSHVDQIPGEVGKLIDAFGFLAASWKMGNSADHAKLGSEIVEKEPEALPPVGSMSKPTKIWLDIEHAVVTPIAPATATAVARDLSSPTPAANTSEPPK